MKPPTFSRDGIYQPRYSGPNRSGICTCGHTWDDHHLGVVLSSVYSEQTKEDYIPQECEYFGCNETGGLDEEGLPHCDYYVDKLDNQKEN